MKLRWVVLSLLTATCAAGAEWMYEVDAKTVALTQLRFDGQPVASRPGAPAGVYIEEVISKDGKAATQPAGDRFAVNVDTRRQGAALLVTVEIVDTRRGETAANVFYGVPLDGPGWVWHGQGTQAQAVRGRAQSQSLYPISVLANAATGAGLAVAITPETPCIFTAGRSERLGLYVQARVGFSAATRPPSRARVCFVVYPIDGEWALRSALREYYRLFPKAYERRTTKEGLWIFHGCATDVPNPTEFAYHSVGELGESQQHQKLAVDILTPEQVRKEHGWGIEIYPYVIPGQREVGFQERIKDQEKAKRTALSEHDGVSDLMGIHYTTAEAFAVLDGATEKNLTFSQAIQPLAEYKQTVKDSCLIGPDGDVVTRPRTTKWAGLALTFPVNPNPLIGGPEHKPCVGSVILAECRTWCEGGTWDGIFIDSLYRWGTAYVSYRREHFPYARYGLSYGPDGRPVLHNALEHLVFLDELEKMVRPRGGKLFANGVREGCFWALHRLDVAGSEFGPGATIEGLFFRRAMSYHKPYLGMNHSMGGKNGQKDVPYLASCFLFGLYGGGEMDYFASPSYEHAKAFYKTYLPIQREMGRLGWEPVTAARPLAEGVAAERFGEGAAMYFGLYASSSDALKSTDLELDLGRLGLAGQSIAAVDAVSGRKLEVAVDASGKARVRAVPISADRVGAVRIERK